MNIQRALTPDNIRNKRRKIYEFDGDWQEAFGNIEQGARILIYGESGNGKTRFMLRFAKYLSQFGRVAYNSLELGDSLALDLALQDEGINKGLLIYNRETVEMIEKRLKRHKSPDIILIDSLQYFRDDNGNGLSYGRYIKFTSQFPNKTLIFISHGEGKQPAGRVAKSVKFDSDCKVFVKGFRAFVTSRYGGGAPMTIWEQGAREYWKEFE